MIVFDLDGTLVHSAPEIIAAMTRAWSKVVPEVPFPRARFRIGPPLPQTIAELAPDFDLARQETLSAEYRALYDGSELSETRPFDGIRELLGELAAHGIPMAIATNKRRIPTETLVQRWFADHFTRIACFDYVWPDDGTRLREKVAMLRWLATSTGTAPSAMIMVGDATTDVTAAHAAGLRSVAVTWGYDDREALRAAKPDALVHDIPGLRAALASMRAVTASGAP